MEMKKILVTVLILGLLVFGGCSFFKDKSGLPEVEGERTGEVIYSFALVADSHLNNNGLARALQIAKTSGVARVFGLGDWTEYGEAEKLAEVKKIFDGAGLSYEVLPGDHDLANSRDLGLSAKANFESVFGKTPTKFSESGVEFVMVDNSDIYTGISDEDWFEVKNYLLSEPPELRFVLAHKTPYNPDTSHIMGSENEEVEIQARQFLYQLENSKVNELFTGDLHHFARYSTPDGGVKITTIGALSLEKNFQGPSFAIVKVFNNYTYEVENITL